VDSVPVAQISILPTVDSVEAGEVSNSFATTMLDKNGHVLSGRTATWTSANEAIATVDAQGRAHGVSVGQTTITAFADGKQATAGVRVIIRLAQIIASPDSMDVPMTASKPIALQLIGPNGEAITGRVVTWASANTTVATVNAFGFVTGIATGTTNVTATVGSKVASIRIRVVPEPVSAVKILPQLPVAVVRLGLTFQLTGQCLGQNSQLLTGRTITWTSSNPTAASVNGAGLVAGVSLGSAVITADCEGAKSTITVQVTPIPVSSVAITPPALNMQVGQQQQLGAVAKDSADNVLSLLNRQVIWTSDNLPVASVSGSGVIAANSAGTAHVQVTVDNVTSPAIVVTVQNIPVATCAIVPNPAPNVKMGSPLQLAPLPRDASGNQLSTQGRTITWSSSDQSVATVSVNGLVSGVTPGGPVTISVTCDGVLGTVPITVIP
jgi:uncharacterized protein YjdB